MTAYTMQNAHHEIALEQHLADHLIATQGYISRKPEDYDRPLAIDRQLVLQFVKDTQPGEWRNLEAQYTTAAEAEFFKQLEKSLKTRGTLDVLRRGIKLNPRHQVCTMLLQAGLRVECGAG